MIVFRSVIDEMAFAPRTSRPDPTARRLTARGLPITNPTSKPVTKQTNNPPLINPATGQSALDPRRQSRIGNKENQSGLPKPSRLTINPSISHSAPASQASSPSTSSRLSILPNSHTSTNSANHSTNNDDVSIDQLHALLISQRFLIAQLHESCDRDAVEASVQYQSINQLISQSEAELEKQRAINQSMYQALREEQIIKQRLAAAQSISETFPLFEKSISQSINQISNRINQIELYGITANQSSTQTINQSIKRASERIERAYSKMHERLAKQTIDQSNNQPVNEPLEVLASNMSSSQSIITAGAAALEQIQSINQSINHNVLSRASHKLTLQNLDYLRDET